MIERSVESIIQMLDADYIENGGLARMVRGVCIDSRKVVEGNLYIPIIGERVNGHAYAAAAIEAGAAAVLWNRSEPNPPAQVTVILVDDTVTAMQTLAHAYRRSLAVKIVGITGSNGKTSTKDMLAAMLSTKYVTQKTLGNQNNEIGVPLTLLALSSHTQCAVVEMGIERMKEMEMLTAMVEPDIAILTNIGTAHMVNMGSQANIAKAKLEITQGMPKQGLLIVPDQRLVADAIDAAMREQLRIQTFGIDPDCTACLHDIYQSTDGVSFCINDNDDQYFVDMLGEIQAYNAAAAYLAARELGIQDKDIALGLTRIEKTGMRNELMQVRNCTILNDSYKSNPQSVIAALDTMEALPSAYKIVLLGDMLDLGKEEVMIHYQLGKALAKYNIQEVITTGDLGCYICQGARSAMKHDNIQHLSSQEEIVTYLRPYLNMECMILVKGSRALHLDEVITALQEDEE